MYNRHHISDDVFESMLQLAGAQLLQDASIKQRLEESEWTISERFFALCADAFLPNWTGRSSSA